MVTARKIEAASAAQERARAKALKAAKEVLTRELLMNGVAALPFDDNGFLATDDEILQAAAKITAAAAGDRDANAPAAGICTLDYHQ